MAEVEISNKDKVLFPNGITKGEFVDYYERVAPYMLPYLKDRPLVMQRYPNGIEKESFFQKNASDFFPDWIKTYTVKESTTTKYVLCNDKRTLLYLANLAVVSFHGWLSKKDRLRCPDKMIFDLDPSKKDDLTTIKETAKAFEYLLREIGMRPYLMSTGSRGVHIIVPLDREADYEEMREFAHQLAGFIAGKDPKRLTIEHRKEKRGTRLFIDTYRNSFAQTGILPYSTRPIDKAPVAIPLSWEEINDLDPQRYNIRNVWERLEKIKDPWEDFHKSACSVKKAKKKFLFLIS